MRRKIVRNSYAGLISNSLLIGLICSFLAYSLKHVTATFQDKIFEKVEETNTLLFIVLPSVGITIIYFLRKYFFKNRQNKGIKEIYTTLGMRKDHLPLYKIPSHYINGFFTVIFGGSTGIEVSTVVSTATVGNVFYKQGRTALAYKTELICAAVAAGVTILFGSPIAGWLFGVEVISRRLSKTIVIACTSSVLVAALFVYTLDHSSLLPFAVEKWHWRALPYFLVLSLLAGLAAFYFTKLVISIKGVFAKIKNNFLRVNAGAITVGLSIFFLPYLYGDSYHGLIEIMKHNLSVTLDVPFSLCLSLLLLVVLKPLVASLTLGAGGDGGVFAPSIVAGAFLGMLFAHMCNHFLGTDLIILNFALIGAAAMLSAAIHAPLTALFLVCNITPNGYALFFPLLISTYVSKYFVKRLYPYNVYTYQPSGSHP